MQAMVFRNVSRGRFPDHLVFKLPKPLRVLVVALQLAFNHAGTDGRVNNIR
jgi:hypothetical protein